MSPSLPTTRPVWVWSLPAFAIILSFLWYRKKRGSLKTDSGGAVETRDDQTSVGKVEEIFSADLSALESVLRSAENRVEVINSSISSSCDDNQVIVVESTPEEPEPVAVEAPGKGEAETGEQQQQQQAEEIVVVEAEELVRVEVEEEEVVVVEVKKVDADIEVIEIKEEPIKLYPLTRKSEIKEKTVKGKSKCGKKKKSREMAKKSNESSLDHRQKKDENTACILEQKLAKLDLAKQCTSDGGEDKQTNDDDAERDSANNSPSEVMLASPSVSGYSDTHSEGSSDSGKGCSEMLTPSRTPASGNSVSGDLPATSIYEFVIPQQYVGRLIGRYGSYIHEIKESTHASIYIKRHPDTQKLKICAIEGTQMDIDSALDMIRRKFPKKRFPTMTLEQVVITPEPPIIPVLPENMQLYLIEGINNDVILSSLVSAGHFFLQQPTHPTYLSLNRLDSCMALCYSEPNQPTIPEGVGAGILCAAPVHDGWYRAQITSLDAANDICDLKFVDYGGYMSIPISMLRQIRADFINLPFQAAECYLAGVKPVGEENVWSDEAKQTVEKLTFGKVLQAQVYGYADDGVPLINLYTLVDNEFVQINQALVDRGYAEWLYTEPVTEDVQEDEEAVAYPQIEESEAVAVAV